MTAARSYALQLLQQGRSDLAEPQLRRALADDADDAELHALLALALDDLGRSAEALAEAERAVGLAPDLGLTHYARAVALLGLDKPRPAEAAAREALRLNPSDVDARALIAAALLERRQWAEAVAMTDQALALDPEHVNAANLRAVALVRLGRRDEAQATVQGVLARDPESAVSHANRGWTLLHQNQPRPAMEAFRESLRLEPDNDWARSGILEAMKARNPVYRLLLRYFLWMSRLSSGKRWGVILGGYLAARFIPGLMVIYLPLVVLTWAGDSFFNLVLFLDPFGRMVLSRDERLGAILMGVCVLGGLALGIGGAVAGSIDIALTGAGLFALALPVGGTFNRQAGRRRIAGLYTAGLVVVGVGAFVSMLMGRAEPASTLATVYIVGIVAFTWLANLMTR